MPCFVGCKLGAPGTGEVSGHFIVDNCHDGELATFPAYHFDASLLGTRRFERALDVVLSDDAVELEETDGFILQIPDIRPLIADATRPLVLPLGRAQENLRASLSLFSTCPFRPTLHATEGEVRFDSLTLQPNPDNAGHNEVIEGSLTATVAAVDPNLAVGQITVHFSLRPVPESILPH
ncbi:MAG: hypothetical protein U1E65_35170 [Myxococcota bacterium]